MDRNCSVMGFLGVDKYEYIMYLSRVLYHLGKNVLMVDCSESGALASCFLCPEGIKNEIMEYRGVRFLDGRNSMDIDTFMDSKNMPAANKYDSILIDYGFHVDEQGLKNCDHLVYVTDQQAHNIRRVSKFIHLKDKQVNLIIKNLVNSRITPKYIISEINLKHISTKQTYVVYQDELDTNCRMNCQYDGVFRFVKLSSQSKNVIKGLLVELLPSITKRELKEAYKKAERGV